MKSFNIITTFIYIIILTFSSGVLFAQQKTIHKESHSLKSNHRISLGLGHTSISQGEVDGETEWLSMPSWSLNYDYWISNKFAIGLQNDIVIESYKVEEHDSETLERNYPVSIIPVIIYKPIEQLGIVGGVGTEIAGGHGITLTRIGIEPGFHLPGNWEAGGSLVWDAKWDHYNSWAITFIISKLLY